MPSSRLAPETAAFYATQSTFSTPGDLTHLYDDLPTDPRELAVIARGLMLNRVEGEDFGYVIPEDRLHDDAETRYLDDILRVITARNPAPLTRRRDPADRFVGICRDTSLLYCSLLRHAGVPARLRCGFADYFGTDGFHADHVVTEYWDDARGWLLADAELADPQVTHEGDFDFMDVPRDRYLVAGAAWQAVRAGEADPKTFGLQPPSGTLVGEWFVAGNVRLDLAALNKTETLLWDVWGADVDNDDAITDDFRALYDEAARLTTGDVPFAAARDLFLRHEGLRTPKMILSVGAFTGPREVVLR
ncbi:transglutaminase-like domain-containing protein [Streptomyces sp. NPDC003077]|uniref:transglutaminase-like domain-containing protein n=1 Tax=Streptomyces sp. NPDC003077 TaxID=3154443 RepID=UPI0033A5DA58